MAEGVVMVRSNSVSYPFLNPTLDKYCLYPPVFLVLLLRLRLFLVLIHYANIKRNIGSKEVRNLGSVYCGGPSFTVSLNLLKIKVIPFTITIIKINPMIK